VRFLKCDVIVLVLKPTQQLCWSEKWIPAVNQWL